MVFVRDTCLQKIIWLSIMAVTIKLYKHQLIPTCPDAKRRETSKSLSPLLKPECSLFLTCTKLSKLRCLEQLQLVGATDLQVATIVHVLLTSSIKETTTLMGSTRLVIKLNTSRVNISNKKLNNSFRAPSMNSAIISRLIKIGRELALITLQVFSSTIIREEDLNSSKRKIMVLTTLLNSRDLHLVTRTHLRTWVWIFIHQAWAL